MCTSLKHAFKKLQQVICLTFGTALSLNRRASEDVSFVFCPASDAGRVQWEEFNRKSSLPQPVRGCCSWQNCRHLGKQSVPQTSVAVYFIVVCTVVPLISFKTAFSASFLFMPWCRWTQGQGPALCVRSCSLDFRVISWKRFHCVLLTKALCRNMLLILCHPQSKVLFQTFFSCFVQGNWRFV